MQKNESYGTKKSDMTFEEIDNAFKKLQKSLIDFTDDFHQSLADNDDSVPLGGRRDELMINRDVKNKPILSFMRLMNW